MIEVELKELIVNYKHKVSECLLKHELHGIEDFEELKEELEAIIVSLDSRSNTTVSLEEHPIDKFGLATFTTQLINSGCNNKTIAELLTSNSSIAITAKEVQRWKDHYSHLSYEKQKKEKQGNVFDVQSRLQDVYSMVSTHLDTIEASAPEDFWKAKTTKQQVMLDTMKEIRMITADAAKIINMVSHQERLRNFMDIVIETVNKIDPVTANTILQKLHQNKTLMSVLTPPS